MNSDNPLTLDQDIWNQHWINYEKAAQENPAQSYWRRLSFSFLNSFRSQTNFNSKMRVLDVGSGQGDFALELRKEFPNALLLGLELSASGVELSRVKVPSAEFIQQNLLEYHEQSSGFEKWATHAICTEVLEHLDNPEYLLENIKLYISSGCKLIITMPGGPRSYFDKLIGHRRHFNRNSLKALLDRTDYRVLSIRAIGFPFFNLYKMLIVARGKSLLKDVNQQSNQGQLPWLARLAMRVFEVLFHLDVSFLPWGWQMIAVVE
jgi:SAM-dependent methyltransferase